MTDAEENEHGEYKTIGHDARSNFEKAFNICDPGDPDKPDAAALKQTGRFYLQVGQNEIFVLGQSGWCGAPYSPSDEIKKEYALLVSVDTGEFDAEVSIDELEELAHTAGAEVVGKVIQKKEAPEKATFVGVGKLKPGIFKRLL